VTAAVPTPQHTEGVLANGTWPYFDTYNIHSYDWSDGYADLWAPAREAAAGRSLWITEADRGTKHLGNDPWFDQDPRLERLKAKHKLDLPGLLRRAEQMRAERDGLVNLQFDLADVEQEIAQALADYRAQMERLRQARRQAAKKLSQLVVKELAQLEMAKARFEVRVEETEPDAGNVAEDGTDRVEFYFSSNPGQPPGKLKDVASGGELSRLMLVLKSISGDEPGATFIFDEIDAGIGGKTAEFVGEKLRQIAARNQVICISHLPQIARFADRHFLIRKEVRGNQTFSSAAVLERGERVREIARLMAGSAINADVLKAAELLLSRRPE